MPKVSALKVIVHSRADAEAALAAGASAGVPVRLLSARGAAAYAGPGWFRELVAQAHAAVPQAEATVLLDCGDRAGDALAAIRAAVPAIAVELPEPAASRIADIAAQAGVAIEAWDDSGALDLATCRDPRRACAEWLAAAANRCK